MKLPQVRQVVKLIRRYKRFLADVELEDGRMMTVHCPNSGSMRGCSEPGSPVVISRSTNKKRKYPWTLEMVKDGKGWIGVNTSMTNKIVHEALDLGIIDDFGSIVKIIPEVRVSDKSRLDFLLETPEGRTYLEVKNCSLAADGVALFPDAITARGTRHLEELAGLLRKGFGAAVLFCIQRGDVSGFMPAKDIDPLYAETLGRVHRLGVQVLAYQAEVLPSAITIQSKIPLL